MEQAIQLLWNNLQYADRQIENLKKDRENVVEHLASIDERIKHYGEKYRDVYAALFMIEPDKSKWPTEVKHDV
jgi:predicted transcriptional regulator